LQEIRLIDEKGKQIGVVSFEEAQKIAKERNLDLIEITKNSQPPIYKLGNWAKEKYLKEKEERKKKLKNKQNIFKNIRIGFNEGEHDLEVKAKKINEFLEDKKGVRIEIFLRGREKAHFDLAEQKIKTFLTKINKSYKIIQPLKRTPNGFSVSISL